MSGNAVLNVQKGHIEFLPCARLLEFGKSRSLQIEEGDVHIWGGGLDGPDACFDRGFLMLDTSEQARAARFVRALDRRRYVLAHAVARVILGRYLDCSPEAVRMGKTDSGKPHLLDADSEGGALCFNLSHSGNRLLFGISRGGEIGVDLEQVKERTDVDGLAARFYSPRERKLLAALPSEKRRQEFFRYWVAKEAVLKGAGVGVTALESCEIVSSENPTRAFGRIKGANTAAPDWTVERLSCGRDWHAAVAYKKGDRTVRCMSPCD